MSGSTECYVLEEVNPVDKVPLSEKGSQFANTKKKAAAQLVFVPSFKSCAAYMNSWTKEANDTESKTTFIQGKKKRRKGFGSLSSLLKSLKTLPQWMMICTKNCLHNFAKQMHEACAGKGKFA
jgi:hypothetical protein